jgi:23S rRNA (cytidine2498-2'-O)-methyltransferase
MRAFYVGTPGFEAALAAELGGAALAAELGEPPPRVLVPGVVAGETAGVVDPVFARQALPEAAEVTGASVRALAEAAFAAVEGAIDRWPGPFTTHAYAPPTPPDDDAPTALPGARAAHTRARQARRASAPEPRRGAGDGGLGSRVALVEQELLALLGERRKRASRRHEARVAPSAFDERVLLAQLLLVARDRLVVSAAAPRALPRGGFDLAPWPAGAAPVADDRAPPSRAYRKLEEAFQWMGAAPGPGDTCVDLGAAPGSWTLMAARRGARVLAVDRAPLAPAVARAPGVTAVAGNAFTYEPPRPVEWLLSDVICEPERAIALVGDWLPRARHLVVTVKFKGRDRYGALAALTPLFDAAHPAFARVKHLAHNKNEVTVMVRA